MILARKTTNLSLGYKLLEVIISERRKGNTVYFYSMETLKDGFSDLPLDEKISKEQAEKIINKWRKK